MGGLLACVRVRVGARTSGLSLCPLAEIERSVEGDYVTLDKFVGRTELAKPLLMSVLPEERMTSVSP